MKFAKSTLLGSGSVVLAGLVLALLVPKAAHAIAATAVQVMNTSSSPAIVSSINDPGRIPFLASTNIQCTSNACFFAFGAVPAGHRVVLQHVSGLLSTTSTHNEVKIFSPTDSDSTIQFLTPPPGASNTSDFDQPVLFYFDGGYIPAIRIFTGGGTPFNGIQFLTLVGYELDCNAAPCAPIASQ